MKPVVVVGAGVIGLAAAYSLRRRGRDVLVVDRGAPGAGCSAGNTGWVCPTYAGPLPAPGLTATALRWMFRSDSPLYLAPSQALGLAPWLVQFWRHCNPRDYARGLAATATFYQGTQAAFDRLADDGVAFELHRDGLLFVYRDRAALEAGLAGQRPFREYGYGPPDVLSGPDVQALEPALADGIIGGYLVREEYHVRPETLTAGYVRRLAELGVEVRSDTEVVALVAAGDRLTAVETSRGTIEPSEVLVAAGALTGRVLAPLGVSLPMTAGKGYSITVADPRFRISRPLSLGGIKVACSPFDGGVRFGGTMELSGLNERFDRRRLAAIRRGVATFFRERLDDGGTEWVGMRPLLPDGLPVIGRISRFRNLLVASGHGMLGVTMAPLTGDAVAALVHGQAPPGLAPFDPDRFSG